MKRSEMLEKMTNLANTYFHNDYEGPELAEYMLNLVEEMGMLPCYYDDPATGLIEHVDHLELDGDFIWEPEDA